MSAMSPRSSFVSVLKSSMCMNIPIVLLRIVPMPVVIAFSFVFFIFAHTPMKRRHTSNAFAIPSCS